MADYFTVDQFRAKVNDTKSPPKFGDDDIAEAHDDVVDRLENWARTAWQVRSTSIDVYVSEPQIILHHLPVVAVTEFLSNGVEADPDRYVLDTSSGILRWGDWTWGMPELQPREHVQLTYTYGYATVPLWLRNSCIKAARSLLMGEEGRSKVPGNVSSYGTERAQVQFRADRGLIRPWPWDERQSQYVRSAWEQHRPKAYMTA